MFSNPMNQNDENRMHLQNVSSEELSVLLRYVYSRELSISNDNVTKLLHASDYLSVLDVHQQCIGFLKNSINPNNCLSIRQFSRSEVVLCITSKLFFSRSNLLMKSIDIVILVILVTSCYIGWKFICLSKVFETTRFLQCINEYFLSKSNLRQDKSILFSLFLNHSLMWKYEHIYICS